MIKFIKHILAYWENKYPKPHSVVFATVITDHNYKFTCPAKFVDGEWFFNREYIPMYIPNGALKVISWQEINNHVNKAVYVFMNKQRVYSIGIDPYDGLLPWHRGGRSEFAIRSHQEY